MFGGSECVSFVSGFQLSDLLSERDQLRALLDSKNSNVQIEKNEFERQLNRSKQELFAEQKKHREQIDSFEERIENLKQQLTQALTEKDSRALEMESVKAKVEKLERQLKDSEKTNLQAIIVSKLG